MSPASERIVYTPELANRALPLVRRIVDDILRVGPALRQAQADLVGAELEGAKATSSPQIRALEAELGEYFEELEQLGCSYKSWNYELGLVDFPAVIDGREVFLCWRSDEETVSHYHSETEGYAGRRKVPQFIPDLP